MLHSLHIQKFFAWFCLVNFPQTICCILWIIIFYVSCRFGFFLKIERTIFFESLYVFIRYVPEEATPSTPLRVSKFIFQGPLFLTELLAPTFCYWVSYNSVWERTWCFKLVSICTFHVDCDSCEVLKGLRKETLLRQKVMDCFFIFLF